jgi:uncharacterized protein (DUF1330 family)
MMTDRNYLISELSEEERESVEKWVRMLPNVFKRCGSYFLDYGAGNQNVHKLLQEMDTTSMMIAEARAELIERHKLPDYPALRD